MVEQLICNHQVPSSNLGGGTIGDTDLMLKKLIKFFKKTEPEPETPKRFVPNQRVKSDEMTDQEKMDQGFNGSTYTLNGRDVDF